MNIGNLIARRTVNELNRCMTTAFTKFCCATPHRISKQKSNQCVNFVVLIPEMSEVVNGYMIF